MTFIQFEKKFGWPEAIACLALAISAWAAWYTRAQVVQNLPDLIFESSTAFRLISDKPEEKITFTSVVPIVITNRGGRTATLVRLEPDTLPPILQVVDGKVKTEHDLETQFALVDGTTNNPAQISELLNAAKLQPLLMPQVINESVESGKSRTFAMVLRVRSRSNLPTANYHVLFSCRAVFSDGTTHRIAQGIGYPVQP
jgi:hypothetical protein